MKVYQHFLIGLRAHVKALNMFTEYKTWMYFLIPLIFSMGVWYLGDSIFSGLQHSELLKKIETTDFSSINTEKDAYNFLLLGIQCVLVFVVLKFNKYIVLLLLSPVLSTLSSQTERLITDKTRPFSWKQLIKDIRRSAELVVKNMLIQMAVVASWFILSLIFPVLGGYVTTVFVFLVGFYFYGFSLIDYTNERRELGVGESIMFGVNHFGFAVAIGGVFTAIFYIPYVGIAIAPILGIVAATVGLYDILEKSNENKEKPKNKNKEKEE